DLVGTGNHAVHGATPEGRNALGPAAGPPIHQIELMAIFIHQTASGAALILNPILRFFLKRSAKLPAPNHARSAHFASVHQLFDLLEKRRIAEFVADHDDAVGSLSRREQFAALLASNATRLFQK